MVNKIFVSGADKQNIIAAHPGAVEISGIITGADKRHFFERSSVFVLVSYAEAFPVAVLEAMAAGAPLIVTPVGALPEILKEGENALFVQPGDVSALVAAIEKLKGDPALCAKMSDNNRRLAGRFSQQAFRTRMFNVFDGIR
jgi:glycosyltransferase involved in cell wall biosynthesis